MRANFKIRFILLCVPHVLGFETKISVMTISAWNNYGVVEKFFESVSKNIPEADKHWFVADRPEEYDHRIYDIKKESRHNNINILTINDVKKSMNYSPYELAFRYNLVCFNTAIKPHVFKHLFKSGYNKVLFFDPDIVIYNPLNELLSMLDKKTFIVTPHIVKPIPDDGLWQTDLQIMRTGLFNYGFLALSNVNEIRLFEHLNWWCDRLRFYGYVDLANGMHFDQNWGIFLTVFEDAKDYLILRDESYNAAYWNLHYTGKNIIYNSTGYYYNNTKLKFFHFSGVSTNIYDMNAISPHQTRFKMWNFPNLKPIFEEYLRNVKKNNYFNIPYGLKHFNNGVIIPDWIKLLSGKHSQTITWIDKKISEESQKIQNIVTEITNKPSFTFGDIWNWLFSMRYDKISTNSLKEMPNIVLIILHISGYDPNTYFDYNQWFQNYGHLLFYKDILSQNVKTLIRKTVQQYTPHLEFCEKISRLEPTYFNCSIKNNELKQQFINRNNLNINENTLENGFNIFGHLNGIFGVAESSRTIAKTLEPLSPSLIELPKSKFHSYKEIINKPSTKIKYNTNIVVLNADTVYDLIDIIDKETWKNCYNIGVWAWELSNFPDSWISSAYLFDEIVVSSTFQKDSIKKTLLKSDITSNIPITVIPFAVERNLQIRNLDTDTFTFLSVFDYHSFIERKNVMQIPIVIEKALETMINKPSVKLIFKCINSKPEDISKLQMYMHNFKHFSFSIIDTPLPVDKFVELKSTVDCFISLHRSEGYGLNILESIMEGIPVISTLYGGNMEYMNLIPSEIQSKLGVNYTLDTIKTTLGPYAQGNVWAEPNQTSAINAVKYALNNKNEIIKDASTIHNIVKEYVSYESVLKKWKNLLEHSKIDPIKYEESVVCYFIRYNDLQKLSKQKLVTHWKDFGIREGRTKSCGLYSNSVIKNAEEILVDGINKRKNKKQNRIY